MVIFRYMNEADLRRWVEANPSLINDRDDRGRTPLYEAARYTRGLSSVLWLLDEKGAEVNATTADGRSALHNSPISLPILNALLDRGADPTMLNDDGYSPLMWHAFAKEVDSVARLLQDPRVRATIDVQTTDGGFTALHRACMGYDSTNAVLSTVRLLLQAGADPTIANQSRRVPLSYLRRHRYPTYLLEQALADIEKTWLLVKARRLVVTATIPIAVAPSYLQHRAVRGQPLPHVAQTSLPGKNRKRRKRRRELHSILAFLLGFGGGPKDEGMLRDVFRVVMDLLMPKDQGMPRDVFRVVMDFLVPSWDPLRNGFASIRASSPGW